MNKTTKKITEKYTANNRKKIKKLHAFLDKIKANPYKLLVVGFLVSILFSIVVTATTVGAVHSVEKVSSETKVDSGQVTNAKGFSDDKKQELNKLATSNIYHFDSKLDSYTYIQSDGELYKVISASLPYAMTQSWKFAIGVLFIYIIFGFVGAFVWKLLISLLVKLLRNFFTVDPVKV